MRGLISNVLHNLARDQQDATQSNKVKMLMSYVSYWHALTAFEVELSKWDMEVPLMHVETLHTTIVWWEKKWSTNWQNILGLESNMANTCI
jgi:hypothetical protein